MPAWDAPEEAVVLGQEHLERGDTVRGQTGIDERVDRVQDDANLRRPGAWCWWRLARLRSLDSGAVVETGVLGDVLRTPVWRPQVCGLLEVERGERE